MLQAHIVFYVAAMQTLRIGFAQARPQRCSAQTCRQSANVASLCCRRSTFSAGQVLQQQQLPQVRHISACTLLFTLPCNIGVLPPCSANFDLQVQTQSLCSTTCSTKGKKLKTRKVCCQTGKSIFRVFDSETVPMTSCCCSSFCFALGSVQKIQDNRHRQSDPATSWQAAH